MKKNEFKLLIENWRRHINESFSDDSVILQKIKKKLDEYITGYFVRYENEIENFSGDVYDMVCKELYFDVDIICKELGLDILSEAGYSRVVYSNKNLGWVLKIARSKVGAEANYDETEISKSKHGQGASDIFVKLGDYDNLLKNNLGKNLCFWLIVEKVYPLKNIDNIEVLAKLFPTFYNMFEDKSKSLLTAEFFKFFIYLIFKLLKNNKMEHVRDFNRNKKDIENYLDVVYLHGLKTKKGFDKYKEALKKFNKYKHDNIGYSFSKEELVNVLEQWLKKNVTYTNINLSIKGYKKVLNLKDFSEIEFFDDFYRFKKAFSYVSTGDLHEGNFGVRCLNEDDLTKVTPEDLVIIDFDFNIVV